MSVDPVSLTSVTGSTPASDSSLQSVAAGFEELLVRQLAQSLVDTTGADGEDAFSTEDSTGGTGTDATTSILQDFLPDALAQSVQNAGGLGLSSSFLQGLNGSST